MSTKENDVPFENHPLIQDLTRFVFVLFIGTVATAPAWVAAHFIYRPAVALVLAGVFAVSMHIDPGIGRKNSDMESGEPDKEEVQEDIEDDGERTILGVVVPEPSELTVAQTLVILLSIGTIFSLMMSVPIGFGALLGTAVGIEAGFPLLGIAIAILYPILDGFLGKYIQYNAGGVGYLIGYNVVKWIYRPIWNATGSIDFNLSRVNISLEMNAFEGQALRKLEYFISKH